MITQVTGPGKAAGGYFERCFNALDMATEKYKTVYQGLRDILRMFRFTTEIK